MQAQDAAQGAGDWRLGHRFFNQDKVVCEAVMHAVRHCWVQWLRQKHSGTEAGAKLGFSTRTGQPGLVLDPKMDAQGHAGFEDIRTPLGGGEEVLLEGWCAL